MDKCDVCGKNSLMPELLGTSYVCKVCFMKINGPFWKYRTYERYEEVEYQRTKVVENATKQNFPPTVLEGINTFFDDWVKGMQKCDACGQMTHIAAKVGEAKLCNGCFSKINIKEWQETDYDDNEEVEENREKILKIARRKYYPSIVIAGINAHFDSKIKKDLIHVIQGRGQTLRVYDTKIILETHSSFSPEDLAADYMKMKNRAQSNSKLAGGAEAIVKGFLKGGVVKAGVSVATNMAAGAVADQFASRSELQAISKGKREIYYENCLDTELIAPGDTELACIKIYTKGSKTPMLFLFGNYSSDVDKASKLCAYIATRIHEVMHAPVLETSGQQSVAAVRELSVADEIMKFKNLLDMGVITQEEFDVKKRQLLGL